MILTVMIAENAYNDFLLKFFDTVNVKTCLLSQICYVEER